MPSEAASPEDRRMTIFHAIAQDGSCERLKFDTEAEAETAADQRREAGDSIYWIVWAESLQGWVSIPEE
jgi:hypothetical protein